MCRSMVDIRSTAAEIRRGKKKEERNYRAKIYMVSLLHRATIKRPLNVYFLSFCGVIYQNLLDRRVYTAVSSYKLIFINFVENRCISPLSQLKSCQLLHHCTKITFDQKDCPFMWHKNVASRFFGLVTKHACGRRTDRRTELRLPRLG